MKKHLFTAMLAIVAVGGAVLPQGEAKASGKAVRIPFIYYNPAQQCATVDCTGDGQDCSELYSILPDTRTGEAPNFVCETTLQPVIGQLNN